MTENARPGQKRVLLRCILIPLIILIILAGLFFFYLLFLQPFYGNPFAPSTEVKSLEYFESGAYRELEKGELFAAQYASYDFLETCEPTDFYYRDNKGRDNFLYGKRYDIYAVSFDPPEHYEDIVQYIKENGTYCGGEISGEEYSYYWMPSSGLVSDRFVFCICDTREFLRFILITELDDELLTIRAGDEEYLNTYIISGAIIRASTLDYK